METMKKVHLFPILMLIVAGLCLFPLCAEEAEGTADDAETTSSEAARLPEAVIMSCYAQWICEYDDPISCSCPGAGSCTSGPAGDGWVECICVGAPDSYRECPPYIPPSCQKCKKDSDCVAYCSPEPGYCDRDEYCCVCA